MIPPSSIDIPLSEIFDRFRGAPIVLREENDDVSGKRVLSASEDENDVLARIRATAESIGLQTRVWTPTTVGSKNFFKNRINITVEKKSGTDDVWHIGKISDDSGKAVASIDKSVLTPAVVAALEEARKPEPTPALPQETQSDITLITLPAVFRRNRSASL
ncbi:MAG TPA: hypothetical protein PLX33_05515 [Alphaproteobacteria bacterium]|nr:hypothetical protein [Alphaproteobacteria bacterium]